MRPVLRLLVIALAVAAPRGAAAQSGGGYDLSWSTLGAGGAVAAGAGFILNGLVSAANAGQASGGTFSLQGGWGGPATVLGTPEPSLPTVFAWLPSSPNPFTRRTILGFALPRAGRVQLAAYDVRGRRVRSFVDQELAAGRHRLEWNGTSDAGERLPSGIYFVKLDAAGIHATSRLVLVH